MLVILTLFYFSIVIKIPSFFFTSKYHKVMTNQFVVNCNQCHITLHKYHRHTLDKICLCISSQQLSAIRMRS